jgi:transcriptional regulator with XRE-family HTH domain
MTPHRYYNYTGKAPIIERLNRIIIGMGLSLKEVEELSGVSRQLLWQWFHGPTQCPKFDNVVRVAIGLGQASMPLDEGQERAVARPRKKVAKLRAVA